MDLTPINTRLAKFAESVGDTPPTTIIDQDGAPSAALMEFRKRHDLTLDWMILGRSPKYCRTDATAAAYRVSSLLRTCVRALDGDLPDKPGDNTAAAQSLEMAIDQLGAVIDALEAGEARKRPTPGPGSLTALYTRLKAIREQRMALVAANGGDDPDTSVFAELEEQDEALCKEISGATPDRDPDAAVMLEWAIEDSYDGALISDLQVQAYKAVATYLRRQ